MHSVHSVVKIPIHEPGTTKRAPPGWDMCSPLGYTFTLGVCARARLVGVQGESRECAGAMGGALVAGRLPHALACDEVPGVLGSCHS